MKNWFKKNKINLLIIIIWAICSFVLIFFHEQWRDEAQQWLLVRDCSFLELFSQLKYEGHFLLWYLILMPFVKLGFPYITANFISWFICLIAVLIINLKSPLKTSQKIFFTFSLPMIYLYPIVSRCYCLIPLAIALISWFYKDRKTKPIRYMLAIALLANSHVIMLGMVGILLLEFFIEFLKERKTNSKSENKKIILSFVLVAILLFITALPLFSSLTANKTIGVKDSESPSKFVTFIYSILALVVSNFPAYNNLPFIMCLIVFLVFFISLFYIKKYKKASIEFSIIALWQVLIYTFIFGSGISNQKIPSLVLVLMFFIWTKNKNIKEEEFFTSNLIMNSNFKKKLLQIFLIIIYVLYMINSVYCVINEIKTPYSTSYQVAEYINENLPENSIFITAKQPEFSSSIIPFIKNNSKFYYLQSQKYFTYITWDDTIIKNIDDDFGIENLREIFGEGKTIYYIYSKYNVYENISDLNFIQKIISEVGFNLIFESSPESQVFENFFIFQIDL